MESKGLFSGAQNVTVNEAIINNVAGAYHDYRRSSTSGPRSDHNTSPHNLSPNQHLDRACKKFPDNECDKLPSFSVFNTIDPPSTGPLRQDTRPSQEDVRVDPLSPKIPRELQPRMPQPQDEGVKIGPSPQRQTQLQPRSAYIETINYTESNVFASEERYRPSLDHLIGNIAVGAIHDSAERYNAPKCHPETRRAVQQDILSWIRTGDKDPSPKRVLWISGPAGAGKTAIAGTIADICQEEGSLAATYFFSASSGSPDCQSKRPFISTLVYQLGQHKAIHRLKQEVLSSINEDPVVFKKYLTQQFQVLVSNPLRRVVGLSNPLTWPKVILIDGVDECDAESDKAKSHNDDRALQEQTHREILSIVEQAARDPSFPFRIVVVSRPEPTIHRFFATMADTTVNLFLDDKYNPDADIALFLCAKFSEMRRRYHLQENWASEEVIKVLVAQASGQFIYAATVIRFVEGTAYHPQVQLERILKWRRLDDSQPFAVLDVLYMNVLRTSPNPWLAVNWLRAIQFLREFHQTPDHLIKAFLESAPGESEHLLGNMTSLISLEDAGGEPQFHFYHQSLLDFLDDPKRSSTLYVDAVCRTRFLQLRWYETLKNRGPRAVLRTTLYSEKDFLNQCFHRWYSELLDTSLEYSTSDANWYLSLKEQSSQDYREMFVHVHSKASNYPVSQVVPLPPGLQDMEEQYPSALSSKVMESPRAHRATS